MSNFILVRKKWQLQIPTPFWSTRGHPPSPKTSAHGQRRACPHGRPVPFKRKGCRCDLLFHKCFVCWAHEATCPTVCYWPQGQKCIFRHSNKSRLKTQWCSPGKTRQPSAADCCVVFLPDFKIAIDKYLWIWIRLLQWERLFGSEDDKM